MALILPFLLLLLLGIIELSILLHDKVVVTNASREGARLAISALESYPSDSAIQSRVNTYLQNHMITFASSSPAATTTVTRAGTTPGSVTTVNVTYQYTFMVLPSFINTLSSTIPVAGETTMRLE
jgi:Flp pilus assembly protein TadG